MKNGYRGVIQVMGNRGRFGKYGETKRLKRLRVQRFLCPKNTYREYPFPKVGNKRIPRKGVLIDSLSIRKANKADLAFVTALAGKVFQDYGPYDKIMPGWFELSSVLKLLAVARSKPVGFVILGPVTSAEGTPLKTELLAIAVEPSWQGRGVGTALLQRALDHAQRMGIKEVLLHTGNENILARNLFEKFGFVSKEEKPGFYMSGQDAISMAKRLKA